LDDYLDRFYYKLAKRSAVVKDNNYAKAKELTAWKENLVSKWDNIEVGWK